MFAHERQRRIQRLVEDLGRIHVTDLAGRFSVSEQTIRKDLLTLESERRLVRVHGGAVPIERGHAEPAFDLRRRVAAGAKRSIGAMAAEIIEDGQTIAFDASTTALEVALRLRDIGAWRQLTVVTNGIRIAQDLAGQAGITVLMPGGRLRWEAMSLVGPWGGPFFDRVNLNHAFVGAAGLSAQAGLTDATEDEAQIKRAMVAGAAQVTAIIDRSKWGRVALATFCPLSRVDRIVTDAPAPLELAAAAARAGITLLEAGADLHRERTAPTRMRVGIRR
jgi:DeoR/GlpR family transcriptional regulator of sugar metabolism